MGKPRRAGEPDLPGGTQRGRLGQVGPSGGASARRAQNGPVSAPSTAGATRRPRGTFFPRRLLGVAVVAAGVAACGTSTPPAVSAPPPGPLADPAPSVLGGSASNGVEAALGAELQLLAPGRGRLEVTVTNAAARPVTLTSAEVDGVATALDISIGGYGERVFTGGAGLAVGVPADVQPSSVVSVLLRYSTRASLDLAVHVLR